MLELKEVQRILSQIEPADNMADELCRKADQSRFARSPREALWYGTEAISFSAQSCDYHCLGVAYLHRWAVYYGHHSVPEIDTPIEHAIEDCEHAREAFELDGDGIAQTISLECLGLTHELRGEKAHHPPDPAKSGEAFRKALDTYSQALGLLKDLEPGYAYSKDQPKLDRCRLLYDDIRYRFFHVAGLNAKTNKPTLAQTLAQDIASPQADDANADTAAHPTQTRTASSDGTLRAGIKFKLPVLREPLAAGHPIAVADDYIAEYTLATRLLIDSYEHNVILPGLGRGNELTLTADQEYFISLVRGNSMNMAGIEDRDYVILSRPRDLPPVPSHRDIIAVVISRLGDTHAMLKRFVMHKGKPTLKPESNDPRFQAKEFTPDEWKAQMDSSEIEISGILVAILKKASP